MRKALVIAHAFLHWQLVPMKAISTNEPIHVVSVSLNVSLNDNHQMLKFQLTEPLVYAFTFYFGKKSHKIESHE